MLQRKQVIWEEKNTIRQNAPFARYFLCLRATTRQTAETSFRDPGVVNLYVNASYFSTTARWARPPFWGPSRLCKQTLNSNFRLSKREVSSSKIRNRKTNHQAVCPSRATVVTDFGSRKKKRKKKEKVS